MSNGNKWKFIGCSIRLDDTDVARVYQHYGLSEAEFKQRGKLLAAAPELLDVLSDKVNDAEQRVFEDWLESKSPSGDHEKVQRQWLESSDYRDFVAEWGDQLAAIAKATGE